MATIGEAVEQNERLLVLPQSEFNRIKAHIKSGKLFSGYEVVKWGGEKHKVPIYQLLGKWANDLDKLVTAGLLEYKKGKTIRTQSLKSAVSKYDKRRQNDSLRR